MAERERGLIVFNGEGDGEDFLGVAHNDVSGSHDEDVCTTGDSILKLKKFLPLLCWT